MGNRPTNVSIQNGISLIETIIAIAIFTLVLGGIFEFVLGGYKAYYYNFQQAQAISEARNGIETMLKEIREAKSGDDGSYVIEKADDYEFIFFSDINKDGKTERVRYFIDGSDFKKGVIEPTGDPAVYITNENDPNYQEQISILSKYIRNLPPIFRYFDEAGQELPAPARLKDTKIMQNYLVINVDVNRAPNDFILKSNVQLRNLK